MDGVKISDQAMEQTESKRPPKEKLNAARRDGPSTGLGAGGMAFSHGSTVGSPLTLAVSEEIKLSEALRNI